MTPDISLATPRLRASDRRAPRAPADKTAEAQPNRWQLRLAKDRGQANLGWLTARFSFSFGPWYIDPANTGFGALVALNEDVTQPGTGFAPHPHADLEILLYSLSGSIEHRDSLGNHAIVRPGDVQRMSAGAGITHSQMNASTSEEEHHLQIWLRPSTSGLDPSVEMAHFPDAAKRNRLCLLASANGEPGALSLNQDARIYATLLDPGVHLACALRPDRAAYLHVARGQIVVAARGSALTWRLGAGDALSLVASEGLDVVGETTSEFLFFDLPSPDPDPSP